MSIFNNLQGGPKGPLETAIQTAFPTPTDVNGVTLPDRPFETYSAVAQEQALLRRAYVDALEAQPNRSYTKTKLKALIQKVAMRPPFTTRTRLLKTESRNFTKELDLDFIASTSHHHQKS